MASQVVLQGKRMALGLVGVLALLLAAPSSAGNDRIFADGFDPCCQIGGTVSGLTGSGLEVHLLLLPSGGGGFFGEYLPIFRNGLYDFVASVPAGRDYYINVTTQPTGQTCTVANGSGTTGSTDIDNANVSCVAQPDLIWDQGNWGDDWQ